MANALYQKWKEQLLQFTANNSLAAGTVKVALIDTGAGGYTFSDTDQFWSAASGASVGTPQTLTSKTYTNGVFDAADVTFNSVTGNSVEALIIFIDTGTASTSPLVAYIDSGVTNLPVTPNGGNISIAWSSGPPAGIFKL